MTFRPQEAPMKYLTTLLCLTAAALLSLAVFPPLPDDVRRIAALLYVGIATLQILCSHRLRATPRPEARTPRI
jgi:hypothetical protein